MQWEPVIGLEVHVQLATRSKIFSAAPTTFGAEPNTQACPVDLGLPGVLPVLNEAVVRMAVRFGLAIGAEIPPYSVFDRKNYFYPDLPKGYQLSQFDHPIVGSGHVTIQTADGEPRRIEITRAHLEEDAGKSVHDLFPGETGIDLNRSGMPLLEVVTEPDFRSAPEAAAFFRKLHGLVRHLKICDGNLAEGSMRCDANVSVRPAGETTLGERTELKNINSFRFLELAIDHEIARQIDILEAGGSIVRETRLYDAEKNETRTMRSKELSMDYRYFPDPDLPPVHLSTGFIESVRDELPELPDARQARYEDAFGLSAYDAGQLIADPDLADYFEATAAAANDPKLAANWVMGELSAALNRDEKTPAQCPLPAPILGRLIERIKDGTISGKIAKTLFDRLWREGEALADPADVDVIIASEGLTQVSDTGEIAAIVAAVVAENPGQVEQFKAGKEKVLGFFVGQVMKATEGKANPQLVNELLREALSK
jgi:aspartyl-tRNA(Asn)/glutamyl-tRNA(Gln) amidotransferase subunit B